jgi:hypothetical protein
MRINKLYIMLGAIIAFGLFFEITAHADPADQATTITFNAPVEIPGEVLPAGTYLFRLVDKRSDQEVVQILNSDGTKLYKMLMTVPAVRQQPTSDTVITLAEQGSGAPDALLTWYYPGSLIGHEFMYPGREEKKLAQDRLQTVAANPPTTHSDAKAGV